jgi:hypothetical protein
MCVTFMTNYFFSGSDVPVDSDVFLMTDFINFKIKLAQFFKGVYRNIMCVCVIIRVSDCMYINICIYIIFLNKYNWTQIYSQTTTNQPSARAPGRTVRSLVCMSTCGEACPRKSARVDGGRGIKLLLYIRNLKNTTVCTFNNDWEGQIACMSWEAM